MNKIMCHVNYSHLTLMVFNVIGKKKIKRRSLVQIEISRSSGQRKMPKTRITSFPALSVDPWVGISLSVSETDDRFCLSLSLRQSQNNNTIFISPSNIYIARS